MTFDDGKHPGLKESDDSDKVPLRFENQEYLEQSEVVIEQPTTQVNEDNENVNEVVPFIEAEPLIQNSPVAESINSGGVSHGNSSVNEEATSAPGIAPEPRRRWDRDRS
ncbi:hypothetical protein ACR2XN_28545 [Klebsiella pneumoniae]